MTHYRKRPVKIEAFQWFDQTLDEWPDWASRDVQQGRFTCSRALDHLNQPILTIYTLEGNMTAGMGDWVIRGLKGEYYPCKNDIFLLTYESVEDEDAG